MKIHLKALHIDVVSKTKYTTPFCTGKVSSHSIKVPAKEFYRKHLDGNQELCSHCVREIERRVEIIRQDRKQIN